MRHPGTTFEVVNAAMTGINSHVILPLARDCEPARADAWVVYMGNNEVVGPFGAGTVFGGQTTPRTWIRAGLALKTTRTGQWLDALRGSAAQAADGSGEWGGMMMFVKYKVAASDPRLGAVYQNFGQNLEDLIAAGQSHGAKIVLSTVAVNLKDCAPSPPSTAPIFWNPSLKDWQRFFEAGLKAQQTADFRQAATNYDEAERIDDSFAELRFRRGQCALALKDTGTAQHEFVAARDLDALRFRCDSRCNDIIRRQASGNVALADGEQALAEASSDGIPGSELFYEHVHLTFQGNYALARAIAEKVETALSLPGNAPWPDIAQCAQRLGHTSRDTQLAFSEMIGRLADAPFTLQANHDEQLRRMKETARQLPPPNSPDALREAQSAAEAALGPRPDDAALWEQLAEIKQARGDYAGAADAAQHSLDKIPDSGLSWQLYGAAALQEGKYAEAAAAFQRVFALDPQAIWARLNYAACLQYLGRRDEAVVEFKRILAQNPDYGTAWLALAQLYQAMGRTNDAQQCYTVALTNRLSHIELHPAAASLRMEAGVALAALGRHDEAARQFQSATDLEPDQAQLHMQLGVELGQLGKFALAEQEFRQAVRLDPAYNVAQVNLGIALYEEAKLDDALKQFEEALRRNPSDPTSLRYVQQLRNRPPGSAP